MGLMGRKMKKLKHIPLTPSFSSSTPPSSSGAGMGLGDCGLPITSPHHFFLLMCAPAPAWAVHGCNSCHKNQVSRIPLWPEYSDCWGMGYQRTPRILRAVLNIRAQYTQSALFHMIMQRGLNSFSRAALTGLSDTYPDVLWGIGTRGRAAAAQAASSAPHPVPWRKRHNITGLFLPLCIVLSF